MTIELLLKYWQKRFSVDYSHAIFTKEEGVLHSRRDAIAKVIVKLFEVQMIDQEESDQLFRLLQTKDLESLTLVESILETKDISILREDQIYKMKY